MQSHPGVLRQPGADLCVLAGAVVVAGHVRLHTGPGGGLLEEGQELGVPGQDESLRRGAGPRR